jgi:D-alanyl-D-alanine carboxypeptidase
VAVTLLSAGCAGSPVRQSDPAGFDRLDAAVTEAMREAKIPGALVGIWSPDGDYVKAFGVADTSTGTPMKTDFYSRIGSVTKTFTATAVLQLVEQGKVGLDDPISRYVDGVPNGQAITVRQLADMRSGLVDYTRVDGFDRAVIADPQRQLSPRELLDWAFREPPAFPAGEKFEYSNTNYILLGLLVEKVTAEPFADYLGSEILGPLNLADTSLPAGTAFAQPHPRGYTDPETDGGPPVDATDWTASLTWTAGAMVSTLDDMRTWVPALATGALLSPDLQQQRLPTSPEPGADFGYGMGIFTVAGWIGHNGSVPGYQTVAVYLPERQTTLVVMINTDIALPGGRDPSEAMATAITSAITPDNVYKI